MGYTGPVEPHNNDKKMSYTAKDMNAFEGLQNDRR